MSAGDKGVVEDDTLNNHRLRNSTLSVASLKIQ